MAQKVCHSAHAVTNSWTLPCLSEMVNQWGTEGVSSQLLGQWLRCLVVHGILGLGKVLSSACRIASGTYKREGREQQVTEEEIMLTPIIELLTICEQSKSSPQKSGSSRVRIWLLKCSFYSQSYELLRVTLCKVGVCKGSRFCRHPLGTCTKAWLVFRLKTGVLVHYHNGLQTLLPLNAGVPNSFYTAG